MALVCIVMTLHRFSWDGLYGTRGVDSGLYLCSHAHMYVHFFLTFFLSIVTWLWMSRLFRTNFFIDFVFFCQSVSLSHTHALSHSLTHTLSLSLFLLFADSLHLWFCPIYTFPHFRVLSTTYLLVPIRLVHVLFPRIYPTLPISTITVLSSADSCPTIW